MAHWRDFGFIRDPFDICEAEKMSEDMLQATFIEHQGLRNTIFDLNHSAVLLTAIGGGKTAHRIMFTRAIQGYPDEVADKPSNPLIVDYLDFSAILDQLPPISLYDHIRHILVAISKAVFHNFVAAKPSHFLNLADAERRWWWHFLKVRQNLPTKLADSALAALALDFEYSVDLASFPHETSPFQMLTIVAERIIALGFDKIYILVEADGYLETRLQGRLEEMFRLLFNTTSFLSIPSIVWKFFVPDSLMPLLENSSCFRTGRLRKLHIIWDPNRLVELLNLHLAWASNGDWDDISRLLDDEAIAAKFDIGTELASLAQQQRKLGAIRAMFLITRELLSGLRLPNAQSLSAPQISLESWENFLGNFLKSLWFESNSQVSVATGALPRKGITLSLQLEKHEQHKSKHFQIRVLESPKGESHGQGTLPFEVATIPIILKALRSVMFSGDIKFSEQQQETLTSLNYWKNSGLVANFLGRFGQDLFGSLFSDPEIRDALIYTQAKASIENDIALQLRFDAEAVDLASIPWELIRKKENLLPLAMWPTLQLQFTRYINYPEPTTPLESPLPLQLLFARSRPKDLGLVESDESQIIQEEFQYLEKEGRVQIKSIPKTTYRELVDRVDETKPSILHFDGHGRFARRCPKCNEFYHPHVTTCESPCNTELLKPLGYLAFEDSAGDVDWVESEKLGPNIGANLRLAVLSACDSGTVRGDMVWGGIGPALINIGVPAVIANQLPISADSAKKFTRGLYRSLAQYDSLPRAVGAGRRRLAGGNEWFVPVLYLRSMDNEGYLFKKP